MELKNKKILEALRVQPLSTEEMEERHILGRLYGPIATCTESTRNGRFYNKELWEKALKDEVFLEKVATKALFLELGHPDDREETDMRQACACIPELPKIVDNDLCAYVDILDTANGRLLKTLVDYGFIPGISSRGSGDIMAGNQVDPETFFLETWDIVQLPAVKKARLNVCESLGAENSQLKKALIESFKATKNEDKNIMKKALSNLNIDIGAPCITEATKEPIAEPNDDDEELDTDIADETEAGAVEQDTDTVEQDADTDTAKVVDAEEDTKEEKVLNNDEGTLDNTDESVLDNEDTENIDDQEGLPETANETEQSVETVGDLIDFLKGSYNKDAKIKFNFLDNDGKICQIDALNADIDSDSNEVTIGITCSSPEEPEDISDAPEDAVEDIKDEEPAAEDLEKLNDAESSAEDIGDTEVIESLKEITRQKEILEAEVSELRKAKSVGDAKEKEIREKLDRYRAAFKSTSQVASRLPKLQSQINSLSENLSKSKETIKQLTEKANHAQQLKECMTESKRNEACLNESVTKLTRKSADLEAKLKMQTSSYLEQLQEKTKVAKAYKARCIETLNRYIESKASMLGVQPSEITSRLNESYTLADVDAVCDQILDSAVNFSRLPFSKRSATTAKISESLTASSGMSDSYEIDESLLELAGLKNYKTFN